MFKKKNCQIIEAYLKNIIIRVYLYKIPIIENIYRAVAINNRKVPSYFKSGKKIKKKKFIGGSELLYDRHKYCYVNDC